jgi:hypothetical protein
MLFISPSIKILLQSTFATAVGDRVVLIVTGGIYQDYLLRLLVDRVASH